MFSVKSRIVAQRRRMSSRFMNGRIPTLRRAVARHAKRMIQRPVNFTRPMHHVRLMPNRRINRVVLPRSVPIPNPAVLPKTQSSFSHAQHNETSSNNILIQTLTPIPPPPVLTAAPVSPTDTVNTTTTKTTTTTTSPDVPCGRLTLSVLQNGGTDEERVHKVIPPPIQRQQMTTPQQDNIKIYLGDDIHAYTHQVNQTVRTHLAEQSQSQSQSATSITELDLQLILTELEQQFGPKPAYANIRNVSRNGKIIDPEVSDLNITLVLKIVWNKIKELNDPSTFRHFNETLDQIGMTCIQGISHRIFIDYIAFCT